MLVGIGVLLLAVGVVVGLFLSRQRALSKRVGSFTCALRVEPGGAAGGRLGPGGGASVEHPERTAAGWTPGVAQYATGRLVWWRSLSLAPRPAHTWYRADLDVLERTRLEEVDESGQPLLRVLCRHRGDTFSLVLGSAAWAGLVSWLESGPRPVGRAH